MERTGTSIIVSPEHAREHYSNLTGFRQPEEIHLDRIINRRLPRKDGMYEVHTKDDGMTNKTKAEIISYCEANKIPYTIEQYEYMNV